MNISQFSGGFPEQSPASSDYNVSENGSMPLDASQLFQPLIGYAVEQYKSSQNVAEAGESEGTESQEDNAEQLTIDTSNIALVGSVPTLPAPINNQQTVMELLLENSDESSASGLPVQSAVDKRAVNEVQPALLRQMGELQPVQIQGMQMSGLVLPQPKGRHDLVDSNSKENNTAALAHVMTQSSLSLAGKHNEISSIETFQRALLTPVKNGIESTDVTKISTSSLSNLVINQSVPGENSAIWAPVKLKNSTEGMSQQLHDVLRDRLQIQADSKIKNATIRLDPPSMGKIEISLQMVDGKLNVQINASQNDVYRALQQVGNELRQNLSEQNFVQVNLSVFSDNARQGQKNKEQKDDEIAAAIEIESVNAQAKHDNSILTTV